MNWPAYPEYKVSGIEWLGDIPSHWFPKRLKNVIQSIDSGTSVNAADWPAGPEEIGVLKTSCVSSGWFNADANKTVVEGDISRVTCPVQGDTVIVNRANTPLLVGSAGSVSHDLKNLYLSDKLWQLRFDDALATFVYYWTHTPVYRSQIAAKCVGASSSMQNLSMVDFGNVALALPRADEQSSIVNFLSERTAKIDALISKQEQLIATLREDRAATVTHAITEGLDPDVEFVEPDGAILPPSPSHWTQRVQLKRVATVQTGLTLGKTVEIGEAVSLPYLRVANVQTAGVNLDQVKTVELHRAEVSNYLLRAGDVLMTEGGDIDKLGRGCLWRGEISPCVHQNHVFAVRCGDGINSGFLVYLLDTSVARNYFFMTAKQTTNLASTNSTTLGRFTFALPPRPEQDVIVEFLDERCVKIDTLIAKANEVIVTMREYRSALITDAVTGKIDVRDAVA
jgi:type I restriction enzyme, S subunit